MDQAYPGSSLPGFFIGGGNKKGEGDDSFAFVMDAVLRFTGW